MKAYRVEIDLPALRQFEYSLSRLRERRASTAVLKAEFIEARALLSQHPEIGLLDPEYPGLRRRLLPRSQYQLYYRVEHDREVITIVAIWHTSRGSGPPL